MHTRPALSGELWSLRRVISWFFHKRARATPPSSPPSAPWWRLFCGKSRHPMMWIKGTKRGHYSVCWVCSSGLGSAHPGFKLQPKPYRERLKGDCPPNTGAISDQLHLPLISTCLNQRRIFRKLPNTRGRIQYRLSYVTSQMCRYKSSVLVRLSCTLMFSPGLQWRDLMLFFPHKNK